MGRLCPVSGFFFLQHCLWTCSFWSDPIYIEQNDSFLQQKFRSFPRQADDEKSCLASPRLKEKTIWHHLNRNSTTRIVFKIFEDGPASWFSIVLQCMYINTFHHGLPGCRSASTRMRMCLRSTVQLMQQPMPTKWLPTQTCAGHWANTSG